MPLLTPNEQLVQKYLDQFNKDDRYFRADQAIVNLFKAFPDNVKLEDVLLKISVINDLYSTNILGTYKMAKHIVLLQIGKRLRAGDAALVNDIASGHGIVSTKTGREINFYSFATK